MGDAVFAPKLKILSYRRKFTDKVELCDDKNDKNFMDLHVMLIKMFQPATVGYLLSLAGEWINRQSQQNVFIGTNVNIVLE